MNNPEQLFWQFGSALRSAIDGVIRIATGKFIPDTCPSCRLFWMLGLAMGVVLLVVYLRGPKTN